MPYLFVGERPSHQAVKIGATWQNGKLAGRTLRETLIALNIDPDQQHYINLWCEPNAGEWDKVNEIEAIERILRYYLDHNYIVVAMGKRVTKVLSREGIPHLQIVHPAARGQIRLRERYQAHVRSVLSSINSEVV